MVRMSLLPNDPNKILFANWLADYYGEFGDKAPNSLAHYISAPTKRIVYDHYVSDLKKLSEHDPISLNDFYNLWSTLFPHYLLRPVVDVQGKCNTCYLIDKGRKETTDRYILHGYQQAHLIHRGGMIMLERTR